MEHYLKWYATQNVVPDAALETLPHLSVKEYLDTVSTAEDLNKAIDYIIIDENTPNDLKKKTENISLHRQAFTAKHGSFLRSEGISWAIKKILHKQQHQQGRINKKGHNESTTKKRCHIVVPYTQGISESFKNICQRYGIQVHFKGGATLKNLLVTPKDKDSIKKKNSVIYWFKCDKIDCEEEYIGESSRTFGEGDIRNIWRHHHPYLSNRTTLATQHSVENFKIIGREGHNMVRAVKEAIYLRVNNPKLNRNTGKYQPVTPLG